MIFSVKKIGFALASPQRLPALEWPISSESWTKDVQTPLVPMEPLALLTFVSRSIVCIPWYRTAGLSFGDSPSNGRGAAFLLDASAPQF